MIKVCHRLQVRAQNYISFATRERQFELGHLGNIVKIHQNTSVNLPCHVIHVKPGCGVTMLVTVAFRAFESFRLVKRRFVSRFKLVEELVPESFPEARLSRWLADPWAASADLKKLNFKLSSTAFLVDHPSKPVAMSLAGLRYQATSFGTAPQETNQDPMCTMEPPMVSMSGNSGPRFAWSLPRVRSRRNFWSKRPRSQNNPPMSVYVLKPERRPSEDEGE